VKQTSNGSSHALKRPSHAGALRGSRDRTERQRTEVCGYVQELYFNFTQIPERIRGSNKVVLAALAAFFTGVAALLVGVGVWGVLHYSVLQHRRDIGVRLALGAAVPDVVRCVSDGVFVAVLAGSAVGLMLAFAAQSYMKSLLYGVAAFEPWMLVSTAALMSAVAMAAALPALRNAIRTEPVITLRSEEKNRERRARPSSPFFTRRHSAFSIAA
jgi:hypothetical protein